MPMSPLASAVGAWPALRALSVGLDLAMGRRPGHAQATAWLSLALARRVGLADGEREAVILAALLKDAG